MNLRRTRLPVLLALSIAWLAAGCGSDTSDPAAQNSQEDSPTSEITVPSVASVDDPVARLAVTYDGGVLVVGAEDGEVVADLPAEGFLRVSPAGDERHVFLASPGSFRAVDLGVWTVDHGDHAHHYVDEPELTDFAVAAEEPGHVVPHDGTTTLFDDATGEMTALPTYQLGELDRGEPDLETLRAEHAHHGVAVRLEDGWIHTVGTTEERSGIQRTDEDGAVVASSEDCPGVHGETFAARGDEDVAVFGCENGVLLVDDAGVTKVTAPDSYARIGNLAGSDESPVVLGDYKVDEDAELERPTRVSLVDTRDASLRLVDLGASYTFRSLGRTPEGDGLVLGTDGALHLVDAERGEVSTSLPVVAPWEEPMDWQEPRPALEVVGDRAFVTEPATSTLHVVDLTTMSVVASHTLPEVPNELAGVAG